MGERRSEGHGHPNLQQPEQQSGVSRFSQFKQDVQTYAAISAVIPLVLFTALSDRQRRAIRDDRDEGKCQFPARHRCTPNRLEVHHISPQGKEKDMCIPEAVRDRKENVITICYRAHQVIVHPDMEEARKEYRSGNKNAFNEVFSARNEKIARGEPYWNTVFDAAMLRRAKQLTTQAEQRGWQMPTVTKRPPHTPPAQAAA